MSPEKKKRIVRLVGVGFDAEDGHVRLTRGEHFDVWMGSQESHDYLCAFIERIEAHLREKGISLEDISPEEFSLLLRELQEE